VFGEGRGTGLKCLLAKVSRKKKSRTLGDFGPLRLDYYRGVTSPTQSHGRKNYRTILKEDTGKMASKSGMKGDACFE